MFENSLTDNQIVLAEKVMPLFGDNFYLTGGTALALLIGHRRSVDFDLVSFRQVNSFHIERRLLSQGFHIEHVMTLTGDEFSIIIEGIRITFFFFPFKIDPALVWERVNIKLPSILSLGAMKAYALGRRSKWKDYVDLYFILKNQHSLEEIIVEAGKVFSKNFNDKLFREQLCFFNDIDYSELIEYIDSNPSDDEIKSFLESEALNI
jgi:predicted nucleotidyltransferase component of viral defense system